MKIIDPESIAYWYFRLNGFLTIQNFLVHNERRGSSRTDADIIGVRFPHRAEFSPNTMRDEELFTSMPEKPCLIFAEVKRSQCSLNGPWTNADARNLHRVLSAVGIHSKEMIEEASKNLYQHGVYENASSYTNLLCIGEMLNEDLKTQYPNVPQLTWDTVLSFIYNRLKLYREQKRANDQWDTAGRLLYKCSEHCQTSPEFGRLIKSFWR